MTIRIQPNIYFNAWPEQVLFEDNGVKKKIDSFLQSYFHRSCEPVFFPLKGGKSDTKNYLLEAGGVPYVLRVQDPKASLKHNQRELFAFTEAAKAGIAPKVYAVSDDFSCALIEYMSCKTLSIAEAKGQIAAAARTMSVLHSLPENPHPRKRLMDQFLKIYEEFKSHQIVFPALEEAMEELLRLDASILRFHAKPVPIHGDMHPRNLFFTGIGNLLIVDWEGVSRDDPFYDLTFFSMMHLFDTEEEARLLESYLQRSPSFDEAERYALCKKTNFIFLALTCLIQAHFSSVDEKTFLKTDSLPADWSYYISAWADKGEHPAQFFYDWGKQCLNQAISSQP